MAAANMAIHLTLYQRRESAAQLGTVGLALLALVGSKTLAVRQLPPPQDDPISVTLMAPPTEPVKVVERVIQPPPPPPPKPVMEPPKKVMPVTEAPTPAMQVPVQPPKVEPPKPQPPQVEPPKAAPKSNPDAESLYTQDVRMRIERKKVYPDTARDLGMTGEVEIEYELDRSGKLLRAEIILSSGFKLLDQAALRAVRAPTFNKIPDDAWAGESGKVFRTKIGFFN